MMISEHWKSIGLDIMSDSLPSQKLTVGWREWVQLPELGIAHIKAKVDTGARTSALHAFDIDTFEQNGCLWTKFQIHPWQQDNDTVLECIVPVSDQRMVSDSGGHREQRLVIVTPLHIGGYSWPIEITLTARDSMKFRMLLGRTAMEGRLTVDPQESHLLGKPPKGLKSKRTNS